MVPISIDGVFGWFSPGQNRRGVIFCGTFGFEQHSAHRCWRDLSETIAATGCAVLRFDYPGEGDSEGRSAGLNPALDAIRRSIRFLREEAGVQEITLVGLRFGGTLAALVAADQDVDSLILLAPFARGRAYLREMEIQGRLLWVAPDGTPLPKQGNALTVGGFVIDPELIQDLGHIDLARAGTPTAKRILLLGADPAGLAARYADMGSDVEVGPLPGLATFVSDARQPRMPETVRAQIREFILKDAPPRHSQVQRAKPVSAPITGAGWIEEPVQFGDGLFGIRCRPHAASSKAPAVLFLNMAAFAHSGYGRQTTKLARNLAENGIMSLRMDLRGVGDSVDRPDGGLPLYKLDAFDEVQAAIDVLTQGNAQPIIAVATCSGAYLAFHSLCRDRRISAAVLPNLYCFDWDLTHGGETFTPRPVRHISAYVAILWNGPAWKRVLTGVTPVRKIVATLARRGLTRLFDQLFRRNQPKQQPLPIAARIAEFRSRGAKLVLLYSAGSLGLVDLRAQLGSVDGATAILGEPVHIIDDIDQSFSAEHAQAVLLREVRRVAATLTADRHVVAEGDQPSNNRVTNAPLSAP